MVRPAVPHNPIMVLTMDNIHPVDYILSTSSKGEIERSIKTQVWVNTLFVTCSSLLLAMFWVRVFTGSLDPWSWTNEQWLLAFSGAAIAGLIAYSELQNYASAFRGWKTIALTALLVFFSWFAESAQTMERSQHAAVKSSQESGVFKAVTQNISNLVNASSASPHTSALASAKAREAELEAKIANKNSCQSCVPESFSSLRSQLASTRGRIAAAEANAANATGEKSVMLSTLISTGQKIEGGDDYQFVMIRWLKGFTGLSTESAMFIFATLLILTFQACYWFSGSELKYRKEALHRLNNGTSPAPSKISLSVPSVTLDTSALRTGTLHADKTLIVNTAEPIKKTGEKVTLVQMARPAMLEVWDAIIEGNITKITSRNPGQVFDFLKESASCKGRGNGELLKIVQIVLDGLEKEEVIIKNPAWIPISEDGKNQNGTRPQYLIADNVVGKPRRPKPNVSVFD